MSNNKNKKDEIMEERRLNDVYHDSKQHRGWIATVLYLTYSLLIINWILNAQNNTILNENLLLFILFLSIIFISSLIFICFQFIYKSKAAVNEVKLKKLMIKISDNNDLKKIWKDSIGKDYSHIFFMKYRIEIPIFIILIFFFILKIYLLLIKSGSINIIPIKLKLINLIIIILCTLIFGLIIGFIIGFYIKEKKDSE